MKKIFKKNQIIITALAIMIIIAGYLNFSQRGDKDLDMNVGDGEVLDYDSHNETAGDDLLDSDLVDSLLEGLEGKNEDTATGDKFGDISDEDMAQEVTDTGEVVVDNAEGTEVEATGTEGTVAEGTESQDSPGEAILVSTTVSPDYFANAKLNREQMRAKNSETLMQIMDNVNLSEEDRAAATQELIKLTSIRERENATETLLEAKGYSDAVVSISDNNVDVIINAVSLDEQDIAQVEDIVKRETEMDITQIVISPAVVSD